MLATKRMKMQLGLRCVKLLKMILAQNQEMVLDMSTLHILLPNRVIHA